MAMPSTNDQSNVHEYHSILASASMSTLVVSPYVAISGTRWQPRSQSVTRYPVLDGGRTTIVAVPIKPSDDGRYSIKRGFVPLKIEYDGIQYVVSDSFSDVYGCGDTFGEALHDYTAELYGHFDELIEREPVLARGLRADLARLRSVIQILR